VEVIQGTLMIAPQDTAAYPAITQRNALINLVRQGNLVLHF
jgi:hypothetical protein